MDERAVEATVLCAGCYGLNMFSTWFFLSKQPPEAWRQSSSAGGGGQGQGEGVLGKKLHFCGKLISSQRGSFLTLEIVAVFSLPMNSFCFPVI